MKKKNRTHILVDGNNLMYRAHNTHEKFRYKGKPTSILYGVPSIISGMAREYPGAEIVVFFDGYKHYKRQQLMNNLYKAQRKEKKLNSTYDQMMSQQHHLKVLLQHLGMDVVHNIKYEADDLIYLYQKKLRDEGYEHILIVSSDKDFHQLISKYVKVYHSVRGLLNAKKVKEIYGYSPRETVAYLSLTGDTSDNIKGVGGIGPSKARSILDEIIRAEEKPNSLFKNPPEVITPEKHRILKLNRVLIDLKLFHKKYGYTPVWDEIVMKGKFALGKYLAMCETYGLKRFSAPQFYKAFEK